MVNLKGITIFEICFSLEIVLNAFGPVNMYFIEPYLSEEKHRCSQTS